MKSVNPTDWRYTFPADAVAFGEVLARNFCPADAPADCAPWAALSYWHLQQGRVQFDPADPFKGLDVTPVSLPPLDPAPAWLQTEDDAPSFALPLVRRADGHLWLTRYHAFDQQLRAHVTQRRQQPYQAIDPDRLRCALQQLFPDAPDTAADHGQRLAAAALVDVPFGLLTGGPGTGKTTSLAKLLLAHLWSGPPLAGATPPPVLMLAPTGKAAQRLRTGLRRAVARLRTQLSATPDLVSALDRLDPDRPDTCIVKNQTLHKALVPRRQRKVGEGPFRHDTDHPLAASLVIVDEVSMVDLALMTRLIAAIPLNVPLLWVGDAEQLESVEAGTVLSDIVQTRHPADANRQTVVMARSGLPAEAQAAHWPQADHVRLTHNYRFGHDSVIGALARSVRHDDPDRFLAHVQQAAAQAEIEWIPLPEQGGQCPARAYEALCAGYRDVQQLIQSTPDPDPVAAVAAFDRFRVLCATRHGSDGVVAWNQRLAHGLFGEKPPVQALLITTNDPSTGWYNGDTGLVLPAADGEALFHAGDGRPGWPATLLPGHEPGWAMTIHKSQGSEYDHVAIVLPRRGAAQLLTRRLLYTALTRARQKITLLATATALSAYPTK